MYTNGEKINYPLPLFYKRFIGPQALCILIEINRQFARKIYAMIELI